MACVRKVNNGSSSNSPVSVSSGVPLFSNMKALLNSGPIQDSQGNTLLNSHVWKAFRYFPFKGLKIVLNPNDTGIEPVTIMHSYKPDFGSLTIH